MSRTKAAWGVVAFATLFAPTTGVVAQQADAPVLPVLKRSLVDTLLRTAVIVEGTVSEVTSEYAEDTGAWTNYKLTDVSILRGKAGASSKPPKELVISQRGGLLPDGSFVVISHQVKFVRGARYLVFLKNRAWSNSPVVGQYALRIAPDGARRVLIGQTEGAVIELNAGGVVLSEPIFTAPRESALRLEQRALIPGKSLGSAMPLEEFMTRIDAELTARNFALAGTFEPAPANRSKYIALKPGADRSSDALPSTPDGR
jgi:hypothetical protein